MLVSEVIDRTFSNWLYPAGVNRPSFDTLASGIDASTPTITLSGRITVPSDSILEIESELVLASSVTGSVVTANERGYLDTTPAIHVSGTKVYLDPMFSRKMVFDTLCAVIGDLYPAGLYQRVVDETLLYTTSGAVALPTGTLRLLKATFLNASTGIDEPRRLKPERGEYEVLTEFTPPKIKLYRGGYEDGEMIIVVAKDFILPADETKDLTTGTGSCGVPSSLVPHLPMGIAGTILQSRELPRVMIEQIKRLLAAQGVQVGAAMNVGQFLLKLFAQKVDAERARLDMLDPPVFELTY